jgi:serine/threonine protein kinase
MMVGWVGGENARTKKKRSHTHTSLAPPPPPALQAAARYVGLAKIGDFGLSKSLQLSGPPPTTSLLEESGGGGGGGGHGGGGGRPNALDARARGVARSASGTYQLTGETGSYRYMAPEVFRHEPYGPAVDTYSLAIIMHELLDGGTPYGRRVHPIDAARRAAILHARPEWTGGGTVKGLRRARRPPPPPALRALVEACWDPDPAARPGMAEVCARLEAVLADLPPDRAAGGGGGWWPGGGGGGGGKCRVQ